MAIDPHHPDVSRQTVIPFKPTLVTSEVTKPTTPSNRLKADPAIVKMFEDLLKQAKAGEIHFAAVAYVDHEAIGYAVWEPERKTSPQEITLALGAVAFLNHRFNQAVLLGANAESD